MLEGCFSRDKHKNIGVLWDLNDTLLNMEKINDVVSLIGINSDYKGQLFGRSLGVIRVDDLVYTG